MTAELNPDEVLAAAKAKAGMEDEQALIEAELSELKTTGTCKSVGNWLDEPDEPDDPVIFELIERGEMFALVGQSKAGKSFLALQLGLCVAAGVPFLGRNVRRSRVYIANLEVSQAQYHKRVRRMCKKLCIEPKQVFTSSFETDWLYVDNLKGRTVTFDNILRRCKALHCELAIVDPSYQIIRGDEKDMQACMDAVEDMKKFQLAKITLGVVFHSPKGFSGDRQLIDMISGSSILARFPESIIGLLNHAYDKKYRVIDAVLRNYAPPDPISLCYEEGAFTEDPEIAPEVENQRTRMFRKAKQEQPALSAAIIETLKKAQEEAESKGLPFKGLPVGVATDKARKLYVRKNGGTLGEKRMPAELKTMAADETVIITDRLSERNGEKLVGLPEQMTWYSRRNAV